MSKSANTNLSAKIYDCTYNKTTYPRRAPEMVFYDNMYPTSNSQPILKHYDELKKAKQIMLELSMLKERNQEAYDRIISDFTECKFSRIIDLVRNLTVTDEDLAEIETISETISADLFSHMARSLKTDISACAASKGIELDESLTADNVRRFISKFAKDGGGFPGFGTWDPTPFVATGIHADPSPTVFGDLLDDTITTWNDTTSTALGGTSLSSTPTSSNTSASYASQPGSSSLNSITEDQKEKYQTVVTNLIKSKYKTM